MWLHNLLNGPCMKFPKKIWCHFKINFSCIVHENGKLITKLFVNFIQNLCKLNVFRM